ncbi:helix-turn-helix domain-containing protein [Variovorax sp. NFACC27]|uniref:GlxA family transcriptional regulator n=1 Tax=unclassified Variovorax TaxID=663243 RepID=UPI00089B84C8|nr:helix-turn-helix domain-containing protein [Variovorax sp. YR750]SEF26162.1 Transcriptional regulator GlxA family, contains an amidase domain and an AraC-type DNA-binding HTH domain [Variovorax sp. NFACC28]SEG53146.1 Transcriptional regulator GlxA family, contains an amidase domain and an AraC-type DNA-binding HTH domain [Variovorax sp. NFACC29]SFC16446.1 Transcriptional regulator GlxA family, contains an amidase domain and an AraC-type DNA-binding HTH domain [Variovorax sp. NFACC26]SFG99779
MPQPTAETVAVVAFDGISPFHLSVPCMVFGEDRTETGEPRFRVKVCAPRPGELRTNAGFALVVPHGLEAIRRAQIVVVPSWRDDCSAAPPELIRALQAAHRRGAVVMGLCLGAFVLAEAGLLDGRPATTHWKLAPIFAKQYPKVKLQPEVLYVDDGSVLTSAGTAAGIDCCLHLLRVRHGAETANRAARRMVVAPHRQGGQAQYIEQPVPAAAERDRLAPLLEWLGRHLDTPHELDDLARRALMSRRNFTRRFRESTGTTVGQWMQNQRLALAQRLLETTDHPVERVATGAGFGSAVSLRKHFVSAFKLSPTAYRQQFSRA